MMHSPTSWHILFLVLPVTFFWLIDHLSVNLGIGLTYALLAREKGARKVIIADLRLTEDAKEAVRSDENIIFLPCNVAVWQDLQAIIDTSLAKLRDVPDVYVASAGVFEPVGSLGGYESGPVLGLNSLMKPYSNFWEDPEPLDANGYASVDINVNHPVSVFVLIPSIFMV